MGSGKSDEIRAKKYFLGEIGNSPLVNKLDIDNQKELDEAEAYFVENALANGLSEKAKELSPDGLKQMHKEIFGELYTWAGSFRDYATGRGYPFCIPDYIDENIVKIYGKLNEKIQFGMKQEDFVKTSAWFIGELNTIHPFIDGNGRTQRKTLDLIAEKAGFSLNTSLLDKDKWYKSAEECHIHAKYDGFENIISSLITQDKTLSELQEKLSIEQLKKDYPSLSDNDLNKITIIKNELLSKYSSPTTQQIALEKIHSQLPDIASGKITLPDLPTQDKGKGGR